MSIPGAASPLFLATAAAAGPAAGYAINRSLRFNSGDSPYLDRTPSSGGNRKTFTWSSWIKFVYAGGAQVQIFNAGENSDYIRLNGDDTMWIKIAGAYYGPSRVFRDYSAWQHWVIAVDTTQGTASNRVKMWVNGVQQTLDQGSGFPGPDALSNFNNASVKHAIGIQSWNLSSPSDFYLADVHFLDGIAASASDFGALDSNGVWQPTAYSGSYGTNGFHLDFSDNSSNAALGTDSSGNSNTWTVNNLQASTGDTTPGQHFKAVTYSGSSNTQSITTGFQPDLVWIKARNTNTDHALFDSVRGTGKFLQSSKNEAEATQNGVSNFQSTGFELGAWNVTNDSSYNFVAWAWKAGGAASSNTDGTITSQVSANQDYGFSIVSYTGAGGSGSFGHGLNAPPEFVILKNREESQHWTIYHKNLTLGEYLKFTSDGAIDYPMFNDAHPNSSVVYVGNDDQVSKNNIDYIAYCFAPVAGYSKFGANNAGTKATTGFKPAFVLWKGTGSNTHWIMFDSKRGDDVYLYSNLTNGDASATDGITFHDDGFTVNSGVYSSGTPAIYMAFADNTSGEGCDSLVDTPEQRTGQTDNGAGGNVVGNYCVWNPLSSNGGVTISNGNLDTVNTGNSYDNPRASLGVSSGKWYWEVKITAFAGGFHVGLATPESQNTSFLGNSSGTWAYTDGGGKYAEGSGSSYGAAFNSVGKVVGVAFDADAGTVTFYNDGVSQGTAFTGLTNGPYLPAMYARVGNTGGSWNFGQRPFANANVPSGYKALCTASLTPTIADGSQYFDTKLYTGNNTASRSVTSYNFSPDFVWVKSRSGTYFHGLFDILRSGYALYSNATNAEDTTEQIGFASDGFTTPNKTGDFINANNVNYVAWAWDAGSSTATNTDGSISSQVRASQTAGFSIATFTGTGASASFGHGLNVAPELVIIKGRDFSDHWHVYHKDVFPKYLRLSTSDAEVTNTAVYPSVPTNSVVNIGTDAGVNTSDKNIFALCFAPVEGYSAFGKYTGNGSADGPFVYTGFKVAWLLTKRIDGGSNDWQLVDATRSPFNVADDVLKPNGNASESAHSDYSVDFISNGFKHRTGHVARNGSGNTYIYVAFASHPFQAARAR